METSIMPSRDLLLRVGQLAIAIGFAFALGAIAVQPTMAADHGHRGYVAHDGGHDWHGGHGAYYPPPTYYGPPNYYYAPPPAYYDAPPPPESEGWGFIFPF